MASAPAKAPETTTETSHRSTRRAEFQAVSTAAALAAGHAIDKKIADQQAALANVEATCKHHEERIATFVQSNNPVLYRKERVELDFAAARRDDIRAKIETLERDRPAAVARAAAESQRLQQNSTAIEARNEQYGNVTLPRLAALIAEFVEICGSTEKLFQDNAEVNQRRVAASLEPLKSPDAPRYAPATPDRQNGTKRIKTTRLKESYRNQLHSPGGPQAYEEVTVDVPVVISGTPEFKPPPIFRRVIVPAVYRDGPSYVPPEVTMPW